MPEARALVVDDDDPIRVMLATLVAHQGYTVETARDGAEAIERLDHDGYNLILLDLMMPHVDGFSILESVREAAAETFLPVIVLTADANEATKLRALRAGATDFLLKPFDQLEVLLRMNNLLETRRLHLQLDMQVAAYADAVRERTSELREAQTLLDKA